jgi:hypothetical protein
MMFQSVMAAIDFADDQRDHFALDFRKRTRPAHGLSVEVQVSAEAAGVKRMDSQNVISLTRRRIDNPVSQFGKIAVPLRYVNVLNPSHQYLPRSGSKFQVVVFLH